MARYSRRLASIRYQLLKTYGVNFTDDQVVQMARRLLVTIGKKAEAAGEDLKTALVDTGNAPTDVLGSLVEWATDNPEGDSFSISYGSRTTSQDIDDALGAVESILLRVSSSFPDEIMSVLNAAGFFTNSLTADGVEYNSVELDATGTITVANNATTHMNNFPDMPFTRIIAYRQGTQASLHFMNVVYDERIELEYVVRGTINGDNSVTPNEIIPLSDDDTSYWPGMAATTDNAQLLQDFGIDLSSISAISRPSPMIRAINGMSLSMMDGWLDSISTDEQNPSPLSNTTVTFWDGSSFVEKPVSDVWYQTGVIGGANRLRFTNIDDVNDPVTLLMGDWDGDGGIAFRTSFYLTGLPDTGGAHDSISFG